MAFVTLPCMNKNQPIAYCYAGCGTCRKALAWLASHSIVAEVLPIRETPPSRKDLEGALTQYGSLRKLFNTSGGDYKELGLKDKLASLSTAEALDLLASRGNLVKRPFVVLGKGRYLVGFDESEWKTALS